jgi:hypothetical protein
MARRRATPATVYFTGETSGRYFRVRRSPWRDGPRVEHRFQPSCPPLFSFLDHPSFRNSACKRPIKGRRRIKPERIAGTRIGCQAFCCYMFFFAPRISAPAIIREIKPAPAAPPWRARLLAAHSGRRPKICPSSHGTIGRNSTSRRDAKRRFQDQSRRDP